MSFQKKSYLLGITHSCINSEEYLIQQKNKALNYRKNIFVFKKDRNNAVTKDLLKFLRRLGLD